MGGNVNHRAHRRGFGLVPVDPASSLLGTLRSKLHPVVVGDDLSPVFIVNRVTVASIRDPGLEIDT